MEFNPLFNSKIFPNHQNLFYLPYILNMLINNHQMPNSHPAVQDIASYNFMISVKYAVLNSFY